MTLLPHVKIYLTPHAAHVHLKDIKKLDSYTGKPGERKYENCVAGEGIIDWPKLVDILKQHNYEGYISIESEAIGDPYEGVTKSLNYIEGILGK